MSSIESLEQIATGVITHFANEDAIRPVSE
jgi:hypothetical protein